MHPTLRLKLGHRACLWGGERVGGRGKEEGWREKGREGKPERKVKWTMHTKQCQQKKIPARTKESFPKGEYQLPNHHKPTASFTASQLQGS